MGLDLIKLLKFVDLNATGIRKILKKFDKRFGYRFTDYYLTSRSDHPYSQIKQVFKHVVLIEYFIFILFYIDSFIMSCFCGFSLIDFGLCLLLFILLIPYLRAYCLDPPTSNYKFTSYLMLIV